MALYSSVSVISKVFIKSDNLSSVYDNVFLSVLLVIYNSSKNIGGSMMASLFSFSLFCKKITNFFKKFKKGLAYLI